MSTIHKGVNINFNLEAIKGAVAAANAQTVIDFFSLYLKNREHFYSLWVKEEPIVYLPFTTNDVAVCKQSILKGWAEVKTFWDPIFDMKGTFDWTIDEMIVSENPDIIITKSRSKVNADTPPAFNNVHLSYEGSYLQIFHFEKGRVKSFEEYYDTDFLNRQYAKK
ncbi:MAG: hypothetical protein PW786_02350 [Arachidicoccus sp.]|nr:hypothetical protein [Arachidicoccus sp.]